MKFYSTLDPNFVVDVPFSSHELCGFIESLAQFPVFQGEKHMHVTLHSLTLQKGNTTLFVKVVQDRPQIDNLPSKAVLQLQTMQAVSR